MKKAALLIMVITAISKLMGFAREMIQSYFYGASGITDAYLISQTIPNQILAFISVGVTTGFISMYSRVLVERDKLGAHRYTSNVINLLLLLSTVGVGIVIVFAQPLVKLFAVGFTGETLQNAVNFTRISVFGMYSSVLLTVFAGYLRLNNRYTVPTIAGLVFNFVIISSLVISAKTSIYVLIVGSVLASFAQFIFFIPFIKKTGYKHKFVLEFNDKYIKMMAVMAVPLIFSRSIDQINTLIDRTLASTLVVGGITVLNYASRVQGIISGFFVDPLLTVLYPNLAKMAVGKNIKGFKASLTESLSLINLLAIPATVGIMLFSKETVALLFGRGAFTAEAVNMTAAAMFCYAIGTFVIGRTVMFRAFYAFQDTKTPMVNACIAVAINIVLNIILSRLMGISGLALATSISAIASALHIFFALRKRIGPFGLKEVGRSLLKISLASAIMACISYGFYSFSRRLIPGNLRLIIAMALGALVYGILIYFMKVPEVEGILNSLKKKVRKKLDTKGR